MWGWIKRWFGGKQDGAAAGERSAKWIDEADSPFGAQVLDARPITLGLNSYTTDPEMAQNAASYGIDQGDSFAGQEPEPAPQIAGELRLRAPEKLVDGALFTPEEMEDKWALFIVEGELVVVRSWKRKVQLRAKLEVDGGELRIHGIRGFLTRDGEPEAYTLRALEFLLRTHALDQAWPAPLLSADLSADELAAWCMNVFGRRAHFGLSYEAELPARPDEVPLRPRSRLHLAVMMGESDAAKAALAAGIPVDLLDGRGVTALHRAAATGNLLDLLLDAGAKVDVVAPTTGATPLMLAVERRDRLAVEKLLAKGARAELGDHRGFTALHRAAGLGEVEIAQLLLAKGADPDQIAGEAPAPRQLAEQRGEKEILALFAKR